MKCQEHKLVSHKFDLHAAIFKILFVIERERSLLKVTSSECSRDEPFIVYENTFATEEECITLCQAFATIPSVGCTFASWEDLGAFGDCILYNEPFADFISHCNQLSGPPDISDCSVENPEENSCDIFRYFGNNARVQLLDCFFKKSINLIIIFRHGECVLQSEYVEVPTVVCLILLQKMINWKSIPHNLRWTVGNFVPLSVMLALGNVKLGSTTNKKGDNYLLILGKTPLTLHWAFHVGCLSKFTVFSSSKSVMYGCLKLDHLGDFKLKKTLLTTSFHRMSKRSNEPSAAAFFMRLRIKIVQSRTHPGDFRTHDSQISNINQSRLNF